MYSYAKNEGKMKKTKQKSGIAPTKASAELSLFGDMFGM